MIKVESFIYMSNYYVNKLSADRLKLCYDIAPPRVKQYFQAEINLIAEKIKPSFSVLELGCGYGRILFELFPSTKKLFGIDVSYSSLRYGKEKFPKAKEINLFQMDAVNLGFKSGCFDIVFCAQNGISAFKVKPVELINEAVRVTKPEGCVLFSSYSESFWNERLNWFQIQSKKNLVGEIDYSLTGNGEIVCKDGFRATTYTKEKFVSVTSHLEKDVSIYEFDGSSIFCEIKV